VARTADEKGALSVFVWKTIADPFAGRITMFRVVSGVLEADSTVLNKTKDAPERLGHLMLMQGKTPANVPEVKAGDLGAVAKLKDTLTSGVLGDKNDPVTYAAAQFAEPVLAYAIEQEPRRPGQDQHVDTGWEDPSIRYSRDPQTELLLCGRGQRIQVTVKLKRRFSVDVNLKPPRIPYARRSRARPGQPPQNRPADTGNSVTAKSRSSRWRAARTSSSSMTFSAGRFRASSFRPWRRAFRKRGCAATSPAFRWSTSASRCSTVRITTSTPTSSRSRWRAASRSRTR
jgi:hypothetical protein